ncbi:MAG: hypothetical protein ACE3JP_06655 [Ectobacillus sp.]
MNKRAWVIMIMLALIVNVVSLQITVESFYGREYSHVTTSTIVSLVSTVIALVAYWNWRKIEYKK